MATARPGPDPPLLSPASACGLPGAPPERRAPSRGREGPRRLAAVLPAAPSAGGSGRGLLGALQAQRRSGRPLLVAPLGPAVLKPDLEVQNTK